MTNAHTNKLIKNISLDAGDQLGGSACHSCTGAYCCKFQNSVGIASTEFDTIKHLITVEQVERAQVEVNKKSTFGGKSSYRCPFLGEDNLCEIYDERFLVCAIYSTVGDSMSCSKENKNGHVNVVNPLPLIELAALDMSTKVRMMYHATNDPSDILQEFISRYNLKETK